MSLVSLKKKMKSLYLFLTVKKKYNSFTNYHLMFDKNLLYFFQFFIKKGNKKKIHSFFYQIFYILKKTTRLCPLFVLKKALENAQLHVEMIPIFERRQNKNKKKLNILFYKPSMYSEQQRIKKSCMFLYDHMKLLKSTYSFAEKTSICILNLFFNQGPIQHKLSQLHSCIGNVHRKKRFFIRRNHFLRSLLKNKNKSRKMRNIKKRIRFRSRFKKRYKIQSVCYQLEKNSY